MLIVRGLNVKLKPETNLLRRLRSKRKKTNWTCSKTIPTWK